MSHASKVQVMFPTKHPVQHESHLDILKSANHAALLKLDYSVPIISQYDQKNPNKHNTKKPTHNLILSYRDKAKTAHKLQV